jgi:hypothetical protein
VEGRRTLSDGLLGIFDDPMISFFLGIFFIWAGWFRARRRPPTSITAGGGRYVFLIVGLLLLCNGIRLWWRH